MNYVGLNNVELFNAIQAEVAAGNVRENRHGDLVLYKYTETCAHDKLWNSINRLCRGVIFDVSGDEPRLVANPFPKFFNLGEVKETMYVKLPDEPFEVFEKMDGSCGIAYFHDGKWRIATPGSLTSDQALRATEMVQSLDMSHFEPGRDTPIFEIIYPENRIVVDYQGRDELVLLAVYGPDYEWSQDAVDSVAIQVGCERPIRYDFGQVLNLPFEDNSEGYVVRFQSGLRVKLKSPQYVRVHRLLEYVSPKRVLSILRGRDEQGEDWRSVRDELPSHILDEFDDISAMLRQRYEKLLQLATDQFHRVRPDPTYSSAKDRKAQALWINKNVPKVARGLVFSLLDGKDIEDGIWKIIGRELKEGEC